MKVHRHIYMVCLFQELAVSDKILSHAALREIVLLGYGTMINKYCVHKAVCPVELIKVMQPTVALIIFKSHMFLWTK